MKSETGSFEIMHSWEMDCPMCGTRIPAGAFHRCEYKNGKWTSTAMMQTVTVKASKTKRKPEVSH